MTDPRCGSYAGYQVHLRAGETTCPDCRAAAAADRRRRAAFDYLSGGQKMTVDATGTRRRVQALVRIGWPMTELADRLGVSFQNVYSYTTRPRVRRVTAARIVALYDELSMIPGPSSSASKRAASKGWPVPLAWDDDDIDNPAARPVIDVPRYPDEPNRQRDMEREAKVIELTRAGLSAAEIAVRLGTYKRYVTRVRSRAREDGAA